MSHRNPYVLDLKAVDRSLAPVVGGKGAHLGELARIRGVRVPAGFCVTTTAFQRLIESSPEIAGQLDLLGDLAPDDRVGIRQRSDAIRRAVEGADVPQDLAEALIAALVPFGYRTAFAIRSSATAEDLPAASFAGQYDTYLNITGTGAILQHIRRCWSSLFTERALTYRLRNGFDPHRVHMGVVVQQMVFPRAAGVLFTADPTTSNRRVSTIEAVFGLGEALVSGRVRPDLYRVRDGRIIEATIDRAVLSDDHVRRLEHLGRVIEGHFGRPQDIEWCLADGDLFVVQSRPITTLYPIPETGEPGNHVFVSVGHQQMMTDPIKPLGLSFWQLTTPRPMFVAGGRLFVDVTSDLASPARGPGLLALFNRSDPLLGDAVNTLLERGDFIPPLPEERTVAPPKGEPPAAVTTDPAIVDRLIDNTRASIAALRRDIRSRSGTGLLDFILDDIQELRRILVDPQSHQVIMAAMEGTWWLNERLEAWLGEKNAADTLTRSVRHNVTSEMGLALLDLADVIRPHPEAVAFLQQVEGDGFLDDLAEVEGGREASEAIRAFLDEYGMRCVGEIDITRPRWSERPSALVPTILGNIHNFEAGAGRRRFERGQQAAADKERELLERLRALPEGGPKADETKRMIDRVRALSGYREFPKYGMICRYFIYKQALLGEAERLVQADVLREPEDIFYLTVQELREVVLRQEVDPQLIRARRDEHANNLRLKPPRVITSDGEIVSGAYERGVFPAGALVGLPVSSGVATGRARVVLDLADAVLEPGDILVTRFTDPSWTPVFLAIRGLVAEVGGLMTHGSVIAREYGLPAVVGVERATELIEDGQHVRVHGTDGYVEVLTPGGDGAI